ncbi:hypothetical protein GGI07_004399 [Coemansia sp. Benny D115]|nr:hypothetical protein GGI07_004399 [Coemansia sp. Benny D115]
MGLLQKDKRGTKGTKPPIPVPRCWIKRIQGDQYQVLSESALATMGDNEKDLVQKLYGHLLSLATASNGGGSKDDSDSASASPASSYAPTWLEQSKHLKAAEMYLVKLTKLASVSIATLEFLRSVAAPMFVEFFFLPTDLSVRRQSIPLIKAASTLDPSRIDALIQANLLAFIGVQGFYPELDTFSLVDREISAEVYSRQTVFQHAQALEALASVPQGFSVIRCFTSDILGYVANALKTSLPGLYTPKQGSGSVELVALREDCTQIVRLAFMCLSRLMSEDVPRSGSLQSAILASMGTPLPGHVDKVLERIYSLAWDVVGCENAALNSRQVAAMVLITLIEGSGLPTADRAAALAHRALDIDAVGADGALSKSISYLPDAEASESRQRCMNDAVSMVCVARAIVSLAPYDTTLANLNIAQSAKNASSSRNVHEAVFTHIASVCGRSQLAPAVKVVVFESMATWLEETARLLNKCLDKSVSEEIGQTAFELGQRILVQQRERIMGYLWSYWDDPLDAVQVKVKAIFEAFLDIGSAMNRAVIAVASSANDENAPGDAGAANEFLNDILNLVLTMDWSRKIKYSLLATLCTRIDLLSLFERQPDIIDRCLDTLSRVRMAPKASMLLNALLERCANDLKTEISSAEQPGAAAANTPANPLKTSKASSELEGQYMKLWTKPVVEALCKDDETSRRMLAQHLLTDLLTTLPNIVGSIIRAIIIYEPPTTPAVTTAINTASELVSRVALAELHQSLEACKQHALIVVLKAARAQDLITIGQLVSMDQKLIDILNSAVYHPDWSVRADMLGLLCETRKLSSPLHELEYDLLFKILRVSANAPSADFRQQQQGALTALATRLVTISMHSERIITTGKPPVPAQKIRHREKAKREAAIAQGAKEGKTETEVLRELGILTQDEMVSQARIALSRVEHAVNQWLDLAVRCCLYPGAGFSKVAMGLRWLDILSSFFTPGRPAQAPDSSMVPFRVPGLSSPNFETVMGRADHSSSNQGLESDNVTAEEVVTVLTQVLIDDPFDANRAAAFSLLTSWPLVAADNEKAVAAAHSWASGLLKRALHLINSTRAGESESGALIVRWIFRKFVVLQGMQLDIGGIAKMAGPQTAHQSPDLVYANGLLAMIRRCQAAAERNLLEAAQLHPLHGLLTAAQYVADEIDYRSPAVQKNAEQWKQWLVDMSETSISVCNVVLAVLTNASPEGNIPSSFREMEDKIDAIIKSASVDVAGSQEDGSMDDDDDDELLSGDVELDGPVGPRQQVILSYCWRAISGVSGLLAAIATKPPGSDNRSTAAAGRAAKDTSTPLLDQDTVGKIGSLLRTLLTSIRHRGAFSAVHPAFTDVCGRMFRSSSAELNHQVGLWLEQCLDIATICQVSVTRRSAGWPLCLLSILTCDKNATQALLPRAMDRIFALASDLQIEKPDDSAADDVDGTTDLPQVHAINMLRVLLDDHTLASDIVPYIEHAYTLSLTGLASRRWAIRNVCSLLYAALTRRVFGNNVGREITKYDGITGRELFTRFPGLHPFLTNKLEDAVDQLAEVAMCDEPLGAPSSSQLLVDGSLDAQATVATAANVKAATSDDKSLDSENMQDSVTTVLRSGARFIHPALYPCLILLSRLQPSPMDAAAATAATAKHPAANNTAKGSSHHEAVVPLFDGGNLRPRGNSVASIQSVGVVASSPHADSATSAVAPPMNLDQEPLTRVNERNSTVHVTSASTMLSMYSFTELVEMCVDNPVYKTREMAARAFAPLVPSEQATGVVVSLINGLRTSGGTLTANTFHGTLCQIHELLRVHWQMSASGGASESLRRNFISNVFPALASLWLKIVHPLGDTDADEVACKPDHEDEDDQGSEESAALEYEVPDIVRHKYLVIVNEFIARGEQWVLQSINDADFAKSVCFILSRFRMSILYGSLHELLLQSPLLVSATLGGPQTPGAYGTVLELVNLFLACIDDTSIGVVHQDGSAQLEIDGRLIDEHGSMTPTAISGGSVHYDPAPVIQRILACNSFYESKLLVLQWLSEHARHENMRIFERIGMDNLLPQLVLDSMRPSVGEHTGDTCQIQQPSTDPLVRAASIRLLAQLCTKLKIDPATFPVHNLLAYWDDTVAQINARHCPLSVATALVDLQAALLHMLRQSIGSERKAAPFVTALDVGQRALAWAQHLYEWTDPERAAPYRRAVSHAVITYSMIKRYQEAAPSLQESPELVVQEEDAASEEMLRLCYWRLLQDDDEDIREFMAESISKRLGRSLACDQACEQLVMDFAPPANGLFPAAYVHNRLAYLLSLDEKSMTTAHSASEVIARAINPNRILFDHENPNVYIDEPRNMQLAYFSLVQLSDIFSELSSSQALIVAGAMKCVMALEAAYKVLLEHPSDSVLSVTALSSVVFGQLQSWILGARLALFAGSRTGENGEERKKQIYERVESVAEMWVRLGETQPMHPWIQRSLRSLLRMCQQCKDRSKGSDSYVISKQEATSDLFLLTYV